MKTGGGGVYFTALRNTIYSTANSVIPYLTAQLNIGNAMNLTSGVFTAPVNGRYFFSFTAQGNVANTILRLNSVAVASSYGASASSNTPISATFNLKVGDRVDTYLSQGSIGNYGSQPNTQFSGFLLEQDLAF